MSKIRTDQKENDWQMGLLRQKIDWVLRAPQTRKDRYDINVRKKHKAKKHAVTLIKNLSLLSEN